MGDPECLAAHPIHLPPPTCQRGSGQVQQERGGRGGDPECLAAHPIHLPPHLPKSAACWALVSHREGPRLQETRLTTLPGHSPAADPQGVVSQSHTRGQEPRSSLLPEGPISQHSQATWPAPGPKGFRGWDSGGGGIWGKWDSRREESGGGWDQVGG